MDNSSNFCQQPYYQRKSEAQQHLESLVEAEEEMRSIFSKRPLEFSNSSRSKIYESILTTTNLEVPKLYKNPSVQTNLPS